MSFCKTSFIRSSGGKFFRPCSAKWTSRPIRSTSRCRTRCRRRTAAAVITTASSRWRGAKISRSANSATGSRARGKNVFVGTPAEVADYMEDWFSKGACDGFTIMPPYIPGSHDDFCELVVPELQRRGLFRTEYEGKTLRENLGLPRPESIPPRAGGKKPEIRGRAPPLCLVFSS